MTSASTPGSTRATATPHWPKAPTAPAGAPNVLIMMLDDVGFADFGCYGSAVATPTIDRLAHGGARYSGFHTTAMCSTTRAALLTGRNHHSVGMGCLANFDSGFPGYRGKLDADAATLAEMLRSQGWRNYFVGKWHVVPLTESGPTGPFDGWPLGRGFDHFYGFLDAETDHYSPELVRDNTHVAAPGDYASGYHLTEDLFDNALAYLKGHMAGAPDTPWHLAVMPGACHAPHQAPKELIDHYDARFAHGWDVERDHRLARQIELGIVPPGTVMPERNDHVQAWSDHTADEQRVFTRLMAAYAAMLDHTDQHFGRLIGWLEQTGQLDNTIVLVLSDNGASQEGGPLGFINAMGPFNGVKESMADKLSRLDDIGGPDTHSNFPWGWAMVANTPLRRYKQNTHGGGIRDPLVIHWPGHVAPGIRHNFCHVSDLAPSILQAAGLDVSADFEGVSFASTFADPDASTDKATQYFEMFGHRGIWQDGWKAVAWHQSGTPFDEDTWELYHLDSDFNEVNDLASAHPERLNEMIELWWSEAAAHKVLPLDDRFAERFAENAERHRGERTEYVFWNGVGHIPSDVAPDLRSRSYLIQAHVDIPDQPDEPTEGVLIAHGDATSGYSFFMRDGFLVHDLNIGGLHHEVVSERRVDPGERVVAFGLRREAGSERGVGTLTIDGEPVGTMTTEHTFRLMVSWSGLDVGFDRGTTVTDYHGTGTHAGPFAFTGTLHRVVVSLEGDQQLDQDAAAWIEVARD